MKRQGILTIGVALALGILAGPAFADEDAAAGEKIFKRCQTCHSLEAGQNKIGPSLAGIIGRQAGSVEGYKYSDALKSAGITWSEDNIDAYLADPKGFVPGNKMAFPGLKKEDEREAVIAYLKQAAQ